jgi:hypothetical protein
MIGGQGIKLQEQGDARFGSTDKVKAPHTPPCFIKETSFVGRFGSRIMAPKRYSAMGTIIRCYVY